MDFDELKVGQKIRVKVLKTRFQSHDEFIMAVGQLEEAGPVAGQGQLVEPPQPAEVIAL